MGNRSFLILLIVFCLATMGANLGSFEADLMEARNFVTAREMLTDGNWWETTMNGEPRLEKPPLPTWITAAFGSLSPNFPLWLLRLPAMLMGVLLVFWIWRLGQMLFRDEQKARWGALVAASSLLIIQMSRTGTWDIYFVSFAVGSFVFFYRGLTRDGPAWKEFAIGGLILGCSVLSKGPVAGIMLVAFVAGVALKEGLKPILARWKELLLAGVLIGVVGFGWPVYHMLFQSDAAQAVIDKESVTWTTKHVKPFYFYLNFPLYAGIWVLMVLMAIVPPLAKKRVGKSYYLILVWIAMTLVLLSLLPMKKERYLLPAMPAVAMLVGGFIGGLLSDENQKRSRAFFWIGLGLVGFAFLASPLVFMLADTGDYSLGVLGWCGLGALSISGALILLRLWQTRFVAALYHAGIGVAAVCMLLLPAADDLYYRNLDFESPSKLANNQLLNGKDWYGLGNPEDMRVVYAVGQKILPIERAIAASQDSIVVVSGQSAPALESAYTDYEVLPVDSSGMIKRWSDRKVYACLLTLKTTSS